MPIPLSGGDRLRGAPHRPAEMAQPRYIALPLAPDWWRIYDRRVQGWVGVNGTMDTMMAIASDWNRNGRPRSGR